MEIRVKERESAITSSYESESSPSSLVLDASISLLGFTFVEFEAIALVLSSSSMNLIVISFS